MNRLKRTLSVALSALTVLSAATAFSATYCADEVETESSAVTVNGIEIGTKQDDGSILLNVSSDPAQNGRVINAALNDNKKRTIVIPPKKFKIERVIWLGNNKTINAKGATIFQTDPQKPLINHACTKTNYNSLKNITINGGTWQVKDNAKAIRPTSTIRFNHAQNITIKNARIDTNYVSHAVELIACKNVTFDKCKLEAKGKQKNDKYAEPLQIDIATKATAPTIASYGKKYVSGQVCKNITVKNCVVTGSRGICTNKTDTENGKWLKKYHSNIKIIGCTVTGMATEALCLHNVMGVTVKNTKAYSKGKDDNYNVGCYLAGMGNNKSTSKYKNLFSSNTFKGGRYGLYIATYSGNKFGKTTVKNNKLYAKNGASAALKVLGGTKVVSKGNKKYKW